MQYFFLLMSIFKTSWIVLQLWKISEKQLFYKILFRDYGILTVTKKKKTREKPIDIGYIIDCEIITYKDRNIHTIGNIKVLWFFQTENRKYHDIESFLKILSLVSKQLPAWSPHYEIYDILSSLLQQENKLDSQKLLLTHLKIISCLWNLSDSHLDPTTQKILKFIHSSKYNDILRLWTIPEEAIKKLMGFF